MEMKQSGTLPSEEILAIWSDAKLLSAITELANVRDDAGVSRFLQRFPNFAPIDDAGWLVRLMQNRGQHPSSTSERFFETLKAVTDRLLPTPESHVKYLSAIVQEIWRGTSEGLRGLLVLLLVNSLSEAIQILIALRVSLKDPSDSPLNEIFSFVPVKSLTAHLQPDWTRVGRFRYDASGPLQKALYAIWGKSSLAKVCRNPDCPAPFFIARRVQQQYCGDECAAPFRLEAKMNWWDNVGKHRREKKASKRSPAKKRQ